MRTIEVIAQLPKQQQQSLYKKCFDLFVDNQDTYKPTYNVDGYQIERRYFLLYVQTYYENYSTYDERRLYNAIVSSKKDNKFEKLKNRYRDAFIMYMKNEDTEEYYDYLANEARISVQTAKRYPFHYYDKYASDEERQLFDEMKNNKSVEAVEQRENNIKDKLKYMFDVCVNSKFSDDTIEQLTEKYSISPKTVKNYVNHYYDTYASDEEKNKYQKSKNEVKIQRENNARYVKIFNYILKESSLQKIILYLLKNNITVSYLKTSLNLYKQTYPEINTEKIINTINSYINYLKYRKSKELEKTELNKKAIEKEAIIEKQKKYVEQKIEKQKELILNLIQLVKAYNKSQYKDYKQFCVKYKISPKQFKCAVRITSRADKETYNQYLNKIVTQNKKQYPEETKIIEKIINGIKETPKFTLLDYYYITKMNLEDLNEFAKKICTIEEYNIFNKFYEKNKTEKTINPSIVVKAEYMINSYGEQIQLDDDTRQAIVSKLQEDNIPITPKIYLEAVRRKIELISQKQKTKVA